MIYVREIELQTRLCDIPLTTSPSSYSIVMHVLYDVRLW